MKFTLCFAAIIGAVTAQAVTQKISPTGSAPAGCSTSYSESFEITVVTPPSKRSLDKRASALVLTLQDGVLTDEDGRTGYIASNYQFQFDDPPQAGAIYTDGWSLCSNGSLALGPQVIFYDCLSGDFYNIYSKNWASQCIPVELELIPGSTGEITSTAGTNTLDTIIATTSTVPATTSTTSLVTAVLTSTDSSSEASTATSDGSIQTTSTTTTQYSGIAAQGHAPGAILLLAAGVLAL